MSLPHDGTNFGIGTLVAGLVQSRAESSPVAGIDISVLQALEENCEIAGGLAGHNRTRGPLLCWTGAPSNYGQSHYGDLGRSHAGAARCADACDDAGWQFHRPSR